LVKDKHRTDDQYGDDQENQGKISPPRGHEFAPFRPACLAPADLHGTDSRPVTEKRPQQAEGDGDDQAQFNSHARDYSIWPIPGRANTVLSPFRQEQP
jgi:hypothetical protein